MSAVEKIKQKDKEERLAKNPEVEEIKGPTLKEILADKTKSQLFGLYLEGLGDEGEDLGRKLKSGKASELGREEFATLNERRKEFLEIMDQSKNVQETLTPEALKDIIKGSPELDDLDQVAGPDAMRNAITRYLPRMAVIDRERFTALSGSATKVKAVKDKMAKMEEDLKKLYEDEYDLNEDEYLKHLGKGDRKKLEGVVRKKLGFLTRIHVRTSAKTIKKKVDELDKYGAIQQQLEDLDSEMSNVGSALKIALMDNETLHEALVMDMTKQGEVPKLEAGMAFSEVKKPNQEEVQAAWEKYQKDNKLEGLQEGPDYEDAVRKFSGEYTSKAMSGKKKGFWARLSEEFWGSAVRDMVKKK